MLFLPPLFCLSLGILLSVLGQVIHIVEFEDKLIHQLGGEFPTVESTLGPNLEEYMREEREWKINSGVIMNSFREFEGKYLNLLAIYAEDNKS